MGSLNLLTHLEPASLLLREGCEAFLPPSLSDALLKVLLVMTKNFPFLLAVAGCSSVCPGLRFWLVSLWSLIWSCAFISLCLEAVLEITLFCLHCLGKARGTACSMSPICLHPDPLCFYKHLNHMLQNGGSLGGAVCSSASLLDPDIASSSVGCWRCESPAPGQYFLYLFSLHFSSQDLSSWVYSLAIGRQQSTVVL